MIKRLIVILLILICFYSCLEPYNTSLKEYEDLLVVNGLITNENRVFTVSLSRSVSNIDEDAPALQDALVIIEDDQGKKEVLTELSPGKYKTDSLIFKGVVGQTYQLYIKTPDGKEYRSEPCFMNPPSEIDSIYYSTAKDWDKNEFSEYMGIDIYIDGRGNSIDEPYLRWTFHEDWKFSVPHPKGQIMENGKFVSVKVEDVICWKSSVATDILIHSFKNQVNREVKKKKLYFIPTRISDKLTMRYSTLVKQYSISKKEYEFWNKLKESTQDIGDVFGKQPFSIAGNIKNIHNPKEPVLGYFQVAGITSKRIYINLSEIQNLENPPENYYLSCPADSFIRDGIHYHSITQIYQYVLDGNKALVEPIYNEQKTLIIGLILTDPVCANCTLTGSIDPPVFWEEN